MSANMHPRVQAASAAISQHLAEIALLYRDGMKLTLLVRDPDYPDGSRDMVVSNDNLGLSIAALKVRQESRG